MKYFNSGQWFAKRAGAESHVAGTLGSLFIHLVILAALVTFVSRKNPELVAPPVEVMKADVSDLTLDPVERMEPEHQLDDAPAAPADSTDWGEPAMEVADVASENVSVSDVQASESPLTIDIGQTAERKGTIGTGILGGGGYSEAKFFGKGVRTRSLCILMDISGSMVAKGVLEDVRRESIKMLQELGPMTMFNIIVFVDGAELFAPQMVMATDGIKARALEWLKQPFNGTRQGNRRGYSGSTPSEAIRMAVELGCDAMFVLTDDPPYLKEGTAETGIEIVSHREDIEDFVRGVEKSTGHPVQINTIVYKPHEGNLGLAGIEFYKKMAQMTGGQFQLVKSDGKI